MQKTASRFKALEKKLTAKPWFKKEGWIASVHGFPREKPEFVTFHLFKKHWFNEDRQGIHIETYLPIDPKKQGETSLTMHVLHQAKVPGTKLKRDAIARPFVDTIYEEVSSWDGYKFRAGKYGQQPFTKLLDSANDTFEKELETEVTRMCRKLGPAMDKVLKEVIG